MPTAAGSMVPPRQRMAIQIRAPGGPEAMHMVEEDLPSPGPGDVTLVHGAIGLNYIDVYFRSGVYPLPALPAVLGQEAAGTVVALGAGVAERLPELRVGSRVAYAGMPMGAYCTARNVRADLLVPIPDAIALETGAAMMLKGMTVHYLFHRTVALKPGQTVLFHAAAGGVGQMACQWAKHLGVRLIGTAGSDAKCALARSLGADAVINYSTEDFVARVAELTGGEGVDVVYDSVGASTFEGSLRCLKKYGTMVSFGNASGKVPPVDLGLLQGHLHITRPSLMPYTASRAELLSSALPLVEMVASGRLRVPIEQRFALKDAADAHRALESRATTGCTVLLP